MRTVSRDLFTGLPLVEKFSLRDVTHTQRLKMSSSETKQKIKLLKKIVLEDQMGFLCEELGDPGRYFPYLRSKRMLDSMDCQSIRSQVTFKEQVQQLIGVLKGRQSSKGEHAFDVLVEALKKQRVQAHIARTLQKALAKAEEENVVPDGMLVMLKDYSRSICMYLLHRC